MTCVRDFNARFFMMNFQSLTHNLVPTSPTHTAPLKMKKTKWQSAAMKPSPWKTKTRIAWIFRKKTFLIYIFLGDPFPVEPRTPDHLENYSITQNPSQFWLHISDPNQFGVVMHKSLFALQWALMPEWNRCKTQVRKTSTAS